MKSLSRHKNIWSDLRNLIRVVGNRARDPTQIIIIAAFIAYVVTWTYIGVAKFYSLNSSVYDLGISMQTAYTVMRYNTSVGSLISFLLTRNGLSILMTPIALAKSYPFMIAIQSTLVGAAVFPIYGISILNRFKKSESLMIAASYLIFFPLSGLVWFDFHYQMFFVFFFLLAYYLYKKNKLKLSIAAFLFSGFCRYPFMIFPLLFSLTLLMEMALSGSFRHKEIDKRKFYFSLVLLIAAVVVIVAGYILNGGISSVPLHTGNSNNPFQDMNIKLLTIFILFAPLLFIPFFSHRSVILSIPFLYLLFTSNSGAYTYPMLLRRQYSSGIVPFLYLGLIEGLNNIHILHSKFKSSKIKLKYSATLPKASRNNALGQTKKSRAKLTFDRVAVTCILGCLVAASFFFQPYGPLNQMTGNNFHLNAVTNINMSIFNSLENVLSIIPANESHVLIQNNIVEALPGPIGRIVLVPQYNVGPNISEADILNNSFPTLEGNIVGRTPIDYAIADVNNQNTLLQFGNSHFPNMIEMCQLLLSSHLYGIRAEENNIVLIQRGYVGPTTFMPFHETYSAMMFHSQSGRIKSKWLQVTDPPAGTNLWYGPYTNPFVDYLSLSPGIYNATFEIAGSNNSSNNAIQLIVAFDSGRAIVNSTMLRGNETNGPGSLSTITLGFSINNIISGLEFDAVSNGWNGTVYLGEVRLTQVGTLPACAIGGVPGMIGVTPPAGTSINATSHLGNYSAKNMIDLNLNTAWISANYSAGITLNFPSVQRIRGIDIALGSYPSSDFVITIRAFDKGWATEYNGNRFIIGGGQVFNLVILTFKITNCTKLEIYCASSQSLIRVNELTLIP